MNLQQRQPDESSRQYRARVRRLLRTGLSLCTTVHDGHRLTRGQGTLADQFKGDDENLDLLTATATQHGRRPNPNDVYKPALANFPGDPAAFVPCDDPENHVLNVCKARGEDCRGVVNYTAPQKDPEPDTGPPIAEDIIQREVGRIIHKDPSLASKRPRVREEFIEKHSPA